ncbi:MAG: hypothetical protein ACI87E_003672 [Mariniblastus sp.]
MGQSFETYSFETNETVAADQIRVATSGLEYDSENKFDNNLIVDAIILGDVDTGTSYPSEYSGDLFFNDLGQGIVRNISFDSNGNITNVETCSTGAQIVVHIQQGSDGNLYYIDLNDGQVGRWVFE